MSRPEVASVMHERTAMYLGSNIPFFACLIAAAYVAAYQATGWGWFLFVAVLLHHSYPSSGKTKPDEADET